MSTYTSYMLLTRDYSRTLANLGKTSQIANAAQYYQANIGKVKTVDDLMKDQRLYTYAMKAAGLEDMTYAKAFMKKVLMSDLSDVDSFANKLTDKRYVEFAKAFNFGTNGRVTAVSDIQSDQQELDIIGLYNQRTLDKESAANDAIARYSSAMDGITSVTQFLLPANREFFDMALTAYGLGDQVGYASRSLFQDILTRGVDDLDSPIYDENIIKSALDRSRLHDFVAAFNFAPSGTVAAGSAQSFEQKSATIAGYLENSGASTQAATLLHSAQTYRQMVGSISTASDLVANKTVYNFIVTAYGFDPTTVNESDILAALQDDSNATSLGLAYQRLSDDFNFDSSGNLAPGDAAQTAAATENTIRRYLANANTPGLPNPSEFTSYRLTINAAGLIQNVDDLATVLTGVSTSTGNPKAISDLSAQVVANFTFRSFGFNPDAKYSKEFLRDVLASDLNDPSSFANQLEDKRWAKLASKFNIDTATGNINGPVQTAGQMTEMLERYVGQGFGGAHITQQAKYAYKYEMEDVRTVDDFLKTKSALSFALSAFGFEKNQPDKEFYRRILTDPMAIPGSPPRPDLLAFRQAFNFLNSPTLPPGTPPQSPYYQDLTIDKFLEKNAGTGQELYSIAGKYSTAIAGIGNVADLFKEENASVLDFITSAYDIDRSKNSNEQLISVLTSNLIDPTSVANMRGGNMLELARAFNFGIAGIVPPGQTAQSQAKLTETVNFYLAKNNSASLAEFAGATATFKARINSLQSQADLNRTKAVDEFLKDAALYNYALTAHGLDPKKESKASIRAALTADASKAFTFLDQLGNDKYRSLAASLNFDPDGSIGTPRQAQSNSDALRLAQKYTASYPANKRPDYAKDRPTEQENLIKAESDYYATALSGIDNVDQLVADKRATTYILKAFGFEANAISAKDLKKILTSNLADSKSFANTAKDLRYREMASMFNFDAKGNTKRVPEEAVQSSGGIYQTYANYLQQTLEMQEGESNNGVRLALYFARKASTITSAYSILGDKALFEVARTALGIPLAAARADIDVLARTINKKLNVADLKDPKKLENFIKRFTANYDIENGGGGAAPTSAAMTVLTGGADLGFSQDMLSGLQRIRIRQF